MRSDAVWPALESSGGAEPRIMPAIAVTVTFWTFATTWR